VWLKKHHKVNKLVSIAISSLLAHWTLSYKHLAFRYYDNSLSTGVEKIWLRHSNEYNFIVWFTFLYYAFHSLAELMELYSTVLTQDRGSLGLLFELNSVLGVVLGIYTTIFVLSGRYKIKDENYQ